MIHSTSRSRPRNTVRSETRSNSRPNQSPWSESEEDENDDEDDDQSEDESVGYDDHVQIVRSAIDVEADEGEEDEPDEADDAETPQPSGDLEDDAVGDWGKKKKRIRKYCRHFSYDLLYRAVRYGWEPEQLSDLLLLVVKELGLDIAQIKKIIEKTRIGTPPLLSRLSDRGYRFSVSELASILLNYSASIDEYIRLVDDALEMELVTLDTVDPLYTLCAFTQGSMSLRELSRFACVLCEHAKSKAICGRALDLLTSNLEVQAASEVIFDVITLDFFYEVPGEMNLCLDQLARCKEPVTALLDEHFHRREQTGDLMDSDEDSEGNLRGFIADEDSIDDDSQQQERFPDEDEDEEEEEEEGDVSSDSDNWKALRTIKKEKKPEKKKRPAQEQRKRTLSEDSSSSNQANDRVQEKKRLRLSKGGARSQQQLRQELESPPSSPAGKNPLPSTADEEELAEGETKKLSKKERRKLKRKEKRRQERVESRIQVLESQNVVGFHSHESEDED